MVPALYSIAALLTLAWLAITLWALFTDRSRGRARCPRCFFSLEGLSAPRCPECGRDVTDERRLHRTRRRWGVAVLAALLLLPPAALTGGLARIKQAGAWADIPTGALVRLLWIGDEALTTEVVTRSRRGDLDRAEAERVVRYAADALGNESRRDQAYVLLEAIAYNSFVITNDRPEASRPMLEELAPSRTVPALLARLQEGDAAEKAKVLVLLSHLRDADERADITILAHLADEDAEVAAGARKALAYTWRSSGSVERLPGPPRWVHDLDGSIPSRSPGAPEAATWLGREIRARNDDRAAIAAFAKGLAAGDLSPDDPGASAECAQAFGLWLWCRLDLGSAACWEAVKAHAAGTSPTLRETACSQATTFEWSGEVESLLRQGLKDPESLVQSAAIESAAHFGPAANSLVPDFLAYAGSARRGGGSAFPENFVAIGGEPRDLLRAIVDRLGRIRARVEAPADRGASAPYFGMDFFWISELNLRDADAAATVRWFIENYGDRSRPFPTVSTQAIVAYATLTGEKTYATEALLTMEPDLSKPLYFGSAQETVLDLMRRQLTDRDMLVQHFVHNPATRQPAEFLSLFSYLSRERLAEFEDVLRELAADGDPTVSQSAAALLQKLP